MVSHLDAAGHALHLRAPLVEHRLIAHHLRHDARPVHRRVAAVAGSRKHSKISMHTVVQPPAISGARHAPAGCCSSRKQEALKRPHVHCCRATALAPWRLSPRHHARVVHLSPARRRLVSTHSSGYCSGELKPTAAAPPVDGPREALALAEDLLGRLRVGAHIREGADALCTQQGFRVKPVRVGCLQDLTRLGGEAAPTGLGTQLPMAPRSWRHPSRHSIVSSGLKCTSAGGLLCTLQATHGTARRQQSHTVLMRHTLCCSSVR